MVFGLERAEVRLDFDFYASLEFRVECLVELLQLALDLPIDFQSCLYLPFSSYGRLDLGFHLLLLGFQTRYGCFSLVGSLQCLFLFALQLLPKCYYLLLLPHQSHDR